MRPTFSIYILAFTAGIIMLASCRTIRSVPGTAIKPLSTGRLLNEVEKNTFQYEYFTVRRINCQYSDNNINANFTITLKAQKNKAILISASKLIPLGSIMLTPDSVKMVNYIEKNYFLCNYTHISKALNVDLNFQTIQALLSNNIFEYGNNSRGLRNFETRVENGAYVITSEPPAGDERTVRSLKTPDNSSDILRTMYFNPVTFALTRLIIDNSVAGSKLEVTFAGFEEIEDKNYPAAIDMHFASPVNEISVKLKMSGFSNETINSFPFSIPGNYTQITAIGN